MQIVKTIPTSTILLAKVVNINNEAVVQKLPPLEKYGKITRKQAAKIAENAYPGEDVCIVNVIVTEAVYRCTPEKFLSVAEKVPQEKSDPADGSQSAQ